MVVGAVAIAVMLPLAWNRGAVPETERQAMARELAEQRADEPAEAEPLDVLVVGDSYTAGANNDVLWPDLLAQELGWRMTNVAEGGVGYVNPAQTGRTFVVQAVEALATASPDLVLFVGGRNDRFEAANVEAAATEAFTTVRTAAPDAQLVVVGPIWDASQVPEGVVEVNEAVAAAAASTEATFIDALALDWLDDPAIIQDDGTHPTDEGQRVLAARIGEQLAPVVAAS